MKKYIALLSLLAVSAVAVTISVGPYDVTILNADVSTRVKPFLAAEPDRQVIVTNVVVEVVDPPVSTNGMNELELYEAVISNGFIVAYNYTNTQWIADPLMNITGDETPQQLNTKYKLKLEWMLGEQIEKKMNTMERRQGAEKDINAVKMRWQSTNDVFEVDAP